MTLLFLTQCCWTPPYYDSVLDLFTLTSGGCCYPTSSSFGFNNTNCNNYCDDDYDAPQHCCLQLQLRNSHSGQDTIHPPFFACGPRSRWLRHVTSSSDISDDEL